MYAIGLDIGTTSICGIAFNIISGTVEETISSDNDSFIKSIFPWEKIQDPQTILNKCIDIIDNLASHYKNIVSIGITGQMHGILYLDKNADCLSPLYTWQDGRGDLIYKDGLTYTQYLFGLTKYKLAAGFGAVTHYYNSKNNLIPEGAVVFCTINDYIAMKLTGLKKPILHISNADSIGLFDSEKKCFDLYAIKAAEIDCSLFPSVAADNYTIIGKTNNNIPVSVAIGDNQAGFLGSVKNPKENVLINIGTGSQVSVLINSKINIPGVECRPFVENYYLISGSSLCGGRAYAVLEKFFRTIIETATGITYDNVYKIMDNLLALTDISNIPDKLDISTLFEGTRENPSLRGYIKNISTGNFTPQHFMVGILEGIADELYNLYNKILNEFNFNPEYIIASGNGVRKNTALQKILSERFSLPIKICAYKEEAAYGSALFSLIGTGYYKNIEQAQNTISYI
jgi:sedoheptulokinase